MKMKKEFSFVGVLVFLSIFAFSSSAFGALTITKSEWRADKHKLDVRAEEGSGSEILTATYDGQKFTMTYKSDKERYELKLETICYADRVTIHSTSGASASRWVTVKEGSAAGSECSGGSGCPDADGDGYDAADCGGSDCDDAAPNINLGAAEICGDGIDQDCSGTDLSCGSSMNITKSEWRADRQKLDVKSEQGSGSDMLTATYDGQDYTMVYKADRNRYELKLEPTCYADQVTIRSTSGASASRSVIVTEGSAAGFECSGGGGCPDADGDGFNDTACGGTDCNDGDPRINPLAAEVCNDTVDQDCNGSDLTCTGTSHGSLSFQDYPGNCLSCHAGEANDVHQSIHYQWMAEAPDMGNGVGVPQGKLTNSVNSYCINILGNWKMCGTCHVGRGLRPDDPKAGVNNIDCLVCHNQEYALARTRLADGSMGVDGPTDSMVQNIQKPSRGICLKCHANAGGGDGVKRGDLSMALISNGDANFDVHMNTASSDLSCQSCHSFKNHKVIGKGSDLRPTDDLTRGSEVKCVTCHAGRDSSSGHATEEINNHVARVACQTCHIRTYAKVATEIHRDWRAHHDNTPADGVSGPGHPYTEKFANLIPEYAFWNRLSDNYLLGDDASLTYDPATGTYPTSRPMGGVNEANSKLYPFKYKTASQPKTLIGDKLIALDTLEYLRISGDIDSSVQKGLVNMGYPANEPYEWVLTDTYQLLNHGVNPSSAVLQCNNCHGNTTRIDLVGELGYTLKGSMNGLCVKCHEYKSPKPFGEMHKKHVKEKRYDCSWCHSFSRPEKGLRMP